MLHSAEAAWEAVTVGQDLRVAVMAAEATWEEGGRETEAEGR